MKQQKKHFIFITIFIFLIFSFAIFHTVSANNFNEGLKNTAGQAGYDKNNTFPENDIAKPISLIINAILSVVGTLFLLLMIYGGFIWMNAKGNESETKKALDIIKNAIIGLVVALAAYSATMLLTKIFNHSTNTPDENGITQSDLYN